MARGSILRRRNKNGTVTYSIKYRSADGTQIKRAVGPERSDAEKALTQALADADKGKVVSTSQLTFAEAAEAWMKAKRPLLEASTAEDYERHLRIRLLPAFGQRRVRQITRKMVEGYVTGLDAEGALSRKTINDSLIPLRQVLGRAVREGVIATNPAESPDRDFPLELPYERPTMCCLSRTQASAYLHAAAPAYRPLAELLIGSGLRISEALALEWGDVDWDSGVRSVTKTFKVGGVGTPKGDRARDVAIADYLMDVLEAHRPSVDASGLVFPHKTDGGPIRRQWVHRFWHRRTLEAAKLPVEVRVHDLRHTAASLWLASGQSIYFVQQQLGHQDIQTTINLYGHPDQAAHRRAAQDAADWWRKAA